MTIAERSLPPRARSTRLLLACGILAPIVYVGSDILAGLSWPGYKFSSQAVSELRGLGAPTRALLVPILLAYAILEAAFGLGIWKTAARKWTLRATGALLMALGALDSMPFFPMNASEGVGSLTNIVHIAATILTLIFILSLMALGSTASGRPFRAYTIISLLIVVVAGALTFSEVPRLAAHLPTPWLGVKERINIYTYMLWMAVLAVVLLRSQPRTEG